MKVDESLPFGFEDTSYQAAGGRSGITRLVSTFYDYMETLPETKPLRDLHAPDLTESREKLTRFLSGWLGGPKLYAEKFGEINIPKAHQRISISAIEKDLWLLCMAKAIGEQPYSKKFAAYLFEQLQVPVERIMNVQQEPETD